MNQRIKYSPLGRRTRGNIRISMIQIVGSVRSLRQEIELEIRSFIQERIITYRDNIFCLCRLAGEALRNSYIIDHTWEYVTLWKVGSLKKDAREYADGNHLHPVEERGRTRRRKGHVERVTWTTTHA